MKRSRVRPISVERTEENIEFAKVRQEVYDEAKGLCEANRLAHHVMDLARSQNDMPRVIQIRNALNVMLDSEHCVNVSMRMHVHHRKYRSRGGTNAKDNLVLLCEPCHAWVHSESATSNILGLSLHANESEEL